MNLFKKCGSLFLVLLLILFLTPMSFAAFGTQEDGTQESPAGVINCSTGLDCASSSNVLTLTAEADPIITGVYTFKTTMIANGRPGASTQVASSSTNLAPANLPYAILLKNIGATGGLDGDGVGTELPDGVDGQTLVILITSGGGGTAGDWVITPETATGWSALTFNDEGQIATLDYVNDTIGWIIVSTGTTAAAALPTITLVEFTGN